MIGEIFLRDLVHLDTDFFSSIMFELRFTKSFIFQESVVNPLKSSFLASSHQIVSNKMISLFFSLPMAIAMRSSLLNDIKMNREKVQCPSDGASAGCTFSQEMPASTINDAFIPVKKTFCALRFRICLAQLIQTALHYPSP